MLSTKLYMFSKKTTDHKTYSSVKNVVFKNRPLCGSVISLNFIHRLLFKDPIIFLMTENKKINGFLLGHWTNNSKKTFFIDLICSYHGFGGQMMEKVIQYVKNQNATSVRLHALPHVINFYRRYGFVPTDNCSKPISTGALLTAWNETKNLRFNDFYAAVQNKSMNKLLKAFMEKKLTADKACKTPFDCGINGYELSLCFPKKQQQKKTRGTPRKRTISITRKRKIR